MTPIGKYIVVANIDEEIKTDGGLLLSAKDAGDMRYRKAKVIKPGTDVSVISDGDIVYYDKGHSFTMVINNMQFTIIQERDVVVVL